MASGLSGHQSGKIRGISDANRGRCPRSPRRGSRWHQPAARAGLVWRLRAKPKLVTPDPAETWGCAPNQGLSPRTPPNHQLRHERLLNLNAILLVVENEVHLTSLNGPH